MEFKFKNRYLIDFTKINPAADKSDLDRYKNKELYFLAEDMNGHLVFQYARGYFHLNLPPYETVCFPKALCGFLDYDEQEYQRRKEEKREKLETEATKIQEELNSLGE